MFTRKQRAQSAMEYLMTYGWAILIIAVVLGVLFSLGVFSGSSLLGTSCVAYAGYYCANPIMVVGSGSNNFIYAASYPVLQVSLGQNTGSSWGGTSTPVLFLCGNQTSSVAAPGYNGASYWATVPSVITNNAAAYNSIAFTGTNTFTSGQVITAVQMVCAGAPALGSSPPVGTAFTGFVWAIYNTGSTFATGANVVVKMAAVSVKVS